jgi:RNA polymerase sigma factor (sigma-70 family)
MVMRDSSQVNDTVCHTNNVALDIEQLVKEHGQYIKQFIYRKLWDKQNAEDIYQTVILEAIRSQHTFKAECHPKYWLMGIASNIIKNMAKKLPPATCSLDDSEGINILDDLLECAAEDPAAAYERDQLLESLQTAFSSLPEDMKMVMVEVINNGNSYMDTAKKLNIAIGTVRSRISRARELMRMQMSYS